MSNEIKVIVQDKTTGTTTTEAKTDAKTPAQATEMVAPKSQAGAQNLARAKTLGLTYLLTKNAMSYATSNVGKYTGNSYSQERVNNIGQAVGLAALSFSNPTMGIGIIGVQVATTVLEENYRKRWEERKLSQSRARYGYSSLKDITTSRRH